MVQCSFCFVMRISDGILSIDDTVELWWVTKFGCNSCFGDRCFQILNEICLSILIYHFNDSRLIQTKLRFFFIVFVISIQDGSADV